MNTTTTQLTHASAGRRTWGELFDERAPLIGAPAFFGPPIIFVLGPWLLLVLLLIGPVALILTLVLVLAVTAALLVAFAAVIASPFLLVRHLHRSNRKACHEDRRYRRHRPHWVAARHETP